MTLPAFLQTTQIVPAPFVDDGLGGANRRSSTLGFSVAKQLQANWCWAAVSYSISKFYDALSTWTQCRIANVALGRSDCCESVAAGGLKCNDQWYLDRALGVTSNFVALLNAPITFSDLRSEIDRGKAIGTRVRWKGGGGHFQAIIGWTIGTNGDQYVTVSDPIYLDTQILVADFADRYQAGGVWTHAYLTTPSTTATAGGGNVQQTSYSTRASADDDLIGA